MGAEELVSQLEKFYLTFRPFPKEQESYTLDSHCPKLGELQITEENRQALFRKYVIESLVVQWVMAGQSQSARLLQFMVGTRSWVRKKTSQI